MNNQVLQRAWVCQAQMDAERGVIECRMCRSHAQLDEATTLWRDGVLVFALCDRCGGAHDICFSPTTAGIEVRARRRTPLVVQGLGQ